MNIEYPKSTISAAAFIKRNWIGCKGWSRDRFLAWLQWHIDNCRFASVREGGRVKAVILFRFVDSEIDARQSEYADTNGHLCYVTLCVSESKRFIRALFGVWWDAGLRNKNEVCWARDKYNLRESRTSVEQLGRRLGYG